MLLLALMVSNSIFAQTGECSSSSMYLQPADKADVTIPFALSDEGKRFTPIWGLDLQWISEQNIRKGINHMGAANIGIGRTGFRSTKALTNDSVLASDQISKLRERSNIFNIISPTLPLTMTSDQEAGSDEYFVKNKSCNTAHWAAMINSHVHWMQQNTQHPIVGVSPFNEPDYWTNEEGATAAKQVEVARLLKQNYPRFADIPIVGGNTLNNDKALSWYTTGKQYYDWGNTHQLAGSFDTFAGFFEQLAKDGKVGYADEMHNVGEAMIGLEYGMTVGIWWGFDSRARGEFCDISRNGVRLAYGEHRNNWTAGSVYRHDDGRVKAFVGSSERQAVTTKYQFVSPERDVYYDGYGPAREFFVEMPGGTGYQNGQTNAERVINVTWGEDVQPDTIDGTYKIVNKATGNVLAVSGSNIVQQVYKKNNTAQQWNLHPISSRIGGDYSFYNIESVSNAKIHINVKDYSTQANADLIAYQQNTPTSNEQWYIEYAGDGYYYIRNRESALYMASIGPSSNNGIRVRQNTMQTDEAKHDLLLWRFLPVDVPFERVAPAQPTGIIAQPQQASVRLSWTANNEEDLAGYIILRAPQGTDDWNTIARKVQTVNYVDNTCQPGTSYIYKVKAIDQAGNLSTCSETAEAQPTGEQGMVARWHFDDNLQDETPNMMDAALKGTATYTTDHKSGEKALRLTSSNYLQLPYEVSNSEELTIALWVKWGTSSNWQRIFDFGNGTSQYMFLTPSNGSIMRFAIKNGGDEQTVNCKQRLPINQWKHIAVSIGKDKTTIFIDGEENASSTGITIKPSDIHPVLNYIGRSQFTADPNFQGTIDDLRIYNYALDADAVKQVMGDTTNGIAHISEEKSADKAIYGVDGRKRDGLQPGINIVDGKKVFNGR